MEEIGNQIYLEKSFAGVTLGAVNLAQGMLLVDSPLLPADQQAWRERVGRLGEGKNRFALMLDTHIDRTLGMNALHCTVLGHEKAVQILSDRPASPRPQDLEAGSEMEAMNLPVNARWQPPAMTFSQDLQLYSQNHPVTIAYRPGGHLAGCWVRSDAEKVVFVGDSVVEHQPPFLAFSNLNIWLDELNELLSEPFRAYSIVSGRSGLVRRKALEKQIELLTQIQNSQPELEAAQDKMEAIGDLLPSFMRRISFDKRFTNLYRRRLVFGLSEYLKRQKDLENQ